MKLLIDLQNTTDCTLPFNEEQLQLWLSTTLRNAHFAQPEAELTLRIVSKQESQQLNSQYRSKDSPTNVLSFPFTLPDIPGVKLEGPQLLGDLVIAHSIVQSEATQQGKPLQAHWAHLCVHGCLHLLGYDHIDDGDAQKMEALEIAILLEMGFDNPY